MAEWGDYSTATKLRDLIRQITRGVLERERPGPRYAVVNTINRTARSCTVTYTGEATPVSVPMGSVQPLAVGQIVRIEGPPGGRFIADTNGDAVVSDSDWQGPPAFLNSWVQYNAGSYPVRYRKIGSVVFWRGAIRAGANNTVAFNVPAVYRPSYPVFLPTTLYSGTTYGPGRLDIGTNGDVYPQLFGLTVTAAAGFILLDGSYPLG